MTGKHTETPWKFDHEDVYAADGSVVIADRPNRHVTPCGHSEWEANAAFIVRAVNAHDRLIAVLENLIASANSVAHNCNTGEMDAAIADARAALSAAKE